MNIKSLYFFIFFLFVGILPLHLWAQNYDDPYANDSSVILNVFGSNLSLTKGKEFYTPAMEDTVNFLKKDNPFINVSLYDISKNFSALQINGGPRRLAQSFTMRGFDKSGVLVLLDGVPIEFLSQHISLLPLSLLPISNVKVIRGPFSSLYGTNALGGVVSLNTFNVDELLLPHEKNGVTIGGGYSTVNKNLSLLGSAYHKTNISDFLASISFTSSKDRKSGDKNKVTISEDNQQVSGLFKERFFLDNNQIDLGYYFNVENVTLPSNPEKNDSSNNDVKNIDHKIDFQTHTLRVSQEYENKDNLLSNVSSIAFLNYGRQDEKATQDFSSPPNTKPFYEKGQNLGKTNYNGGIFHKQNIDIDFNKYISTSLIYGINYKGQQQRKHDTDPRGLVANAKANNIALFLQNELFLTEKFTLLGALRYDYFNIRHIGEYKFNLPQKDSDLPKQKIYNQISPKISLTYKPVDYFMVYTSYGRAFKTPNLNEMFSSGVHFMVGKYTNVLLPNPSLRPTTSDTVEIGYGINFNNLDNENEISFKNAFYYTVAKDFIILNVTRTTSQYLNVNNVKIGGTDLTFSYKNNFGSASITYNYINTIDTATGKELVNISAHTLKYNTEVKIPYSQFFIGYNIKAQSPFMMNKSPSLTSSSNQQRMPGFTVFDIYTGVASKRFKISFNIDNILDKFYYDTFSGIPSSGRNYRVFFTMKL